MSDIALLVIDMQVGNFSDPDPITGGNELLRKIKSLVVKARSAHVPIVYIQNCGDSGDPGEVMTVRWMTPEEIRENPQTSPWMCQSLEKIEKRRITKGWRRARQVVSWQVTNGQSRNQRRSDNEGIQID